MVDAIADRLHKQGSSSVSIRAIQLQGSSDVAGASGCRLFAPLSCVVVRSVMSDSVVMKGVTQS